MIKACWKDIWRTISKGKKRFISIASIAALGVTMMCGLRASCVDLRYSADQFFDEQQLFDIQILSTLGITKEDVKVLQNVKEVDVAEGGYNETVYTEIDEVKKSIQISLICIMKGITNIAGCFFFSHPDTDGVAAFCIFKQFIL